MTRYVHFVYNEEDAFAVLGIPYTLKKSN